MKFLIVALALCATAYAALPSNEYLPPLEDASPVNNADLQSLSEQSGGLADDGYRYKTVKRYRLRHRRDVNELPSNEYLPPVAESAPVEVAVEESAPLADDGYRYRTVKRYRLRQRRRRDVNELPSNEYLPPASAAAPSNAAPFVADIPVAAVAAQESQDTAVLADDGYRYKTVKRYRLRHRRDVNELPSNEYLPPVAESAPVEVAVEESAPLADDGYRYRTVKRYRLRQRRRRDVNELPSNEYLPPVAESAPVAVAAEESAALADDGYRYKTVRRRVYRRRV